LWYREGQLPVNTSDRDPEIFVIKPGESIDAIATNLEKEGLIRNKIVFKILVKQLNIERSIQAGDFRLYPSMSASEIAQNLTHGTLDTWVTVIEGLRREEIAQLIADSHDIPESVFVEKTKEGYLFPDTYLVPTSADVNTIIEMFEKNFNEKVTPEMVQAAEKKGYTLDELLTLASLLERETQDYEDMRIVAGILENRLEEDMPLQIDATVQYALGYDEGEKTWWKKNLTIEDLDIDSMFNTYKVTGLPPHPIASPGLNAINAVLNAKDVPYFYYITDNTGRMHYSETLDQHNANVEKYLR
jgi:UPF0755 protein